MGKNIKIGKVVSTKMHKSIVVNVERLKSHPLYKKNYRVSKHYLVHDPENKCKINDIVRITENKPISKLKKWRMVDIIHKKANK